LDEIQQDYEDFASNPGHRFKLGYPSIDAEIKGVAPGEICVLAAGRSTGKTNVFCNVIHNNPDQPIAFFSLEMTKRLIWPRLYATHYGVEYRSLEEEVRNGLALQPLDTLPKVGVCDISGMSIKEIEEAIEEYRADKGESPRLVMIDYS